MSEPEFVLGESVDEVTTAFGTRLKPERWQRRTREPDGSLAHRVTGLTFVSAQGDFITEMRKVASGETGAFGDGDGRLPPLRVHRCARGQPHPPFDHAIEHPAADDHGRQPQ